MQLVIRQRLAPATHAALCAGSAGPWALKAAGRSAWGGSSWYHDVPVCSLRPGGLEAVYAVAGLWPPGLFIPDREKMAIWISGGGAIALPCAALWMYMTVTYSASLPVGGGRLSSLARADNCPGACRSRRLGRWCTVVSELLSCKTRQTSDQAADGLDTLTLFLPAPSTSRASRHSTTGMRLMKHRVRVLSQCPYSQSD